MKKFSYRAAVTLVIAALSGMLVPPASARAVTWSDPDLVAAAGPAVVSLHRDNIYGSSWVDETPGPDNQYCSGVLVASNWVLTAGHCLKDLLFNRLAPAGDITVGVHLPTGVVYMHAVELVAHPAYGVWGVKRDPTGGVDLGLIRLPRPVDVAPIQIASIDDGLRSDVIVYGFGRDENNQKLGRLGASRVYFDDAWAERRGFPATPERLVAFGLWRTPSCEPGTGVDDVPCVGVTDVRDVKVSAACTGDSGGPLVGTDPSGVRAVIGIVSFGPAGNCGARMPFGSVRVASYADWIVPIVSQPVPPAPEPVKIDRGRPGKGRKAKP